MRERRLRVPVVALIAALATTLVAFVLPGAATSAPPGCSTRTNTTYQQLLSCVTVEGVREHQAAFQAIADANNDPFAPGSRAAGTDGYTGSVDYVAGLLEDAGYTVTLDEFAYEFAGASLRQTAPITATYATGAFTGTGEGTVSASVTAVDVNLVLPRDPVTSGCEAADFAGSPAGTIALVQRGTCSFGIKATNAQAAGAAAVVVFNQGNTTDRSGLIVGTLLPDGASVTIPVVGASFADGAALAQPGSSATVSVVLESRPRSTSSPRKPGRTTTTSSWPVRISTACRRGPGSMTTAPARLHSSRPR